MKCKNCLGDKFIQYTLEQVKYTGQLDSNGEMNLEKAKEYHCNVENYEEFALRRLRG